MDFFFFFFKRNRNERKTSQRRKIPDLNCPTTRSQQKRQKLKDDLRQEVQAYDAAMQEGTPLKQLYMLMIHTHKHEKKNKSQIKGDSK